MDQLKTSEQQNETLQNKFQNAQGNFRKILTKHEEEINKQTESYLKLKRDLDNILSEKEKFNKDL